ANPVQEVPDGQSCAQIDFVHPRLASPVKLCPLTLTAEPTRLAPPQEINIQLAKLHIFQPLPTSRLFSAPTAGNLTLIDPKSPKTMHFKLVALLAFAVEAMAATMENMPGMDMNPPPGPPATTPPPGVKQGDLLRVLLTALPTSLLNIALTNQPAVSSIIASEFNAGITEPWFKSLPPPVQTYLENQGKQGAPAVPTGTGPSPTTPGAPFTNVTTPGATTPRMTESPTMTMTMPMTSTLTTSEFGTSSLENRPKTTPAANQTTTAGAMPLPLPTAAIGAGVAGALGIMGILGL
ncbi:hypothetical protein IWX90DRAFT_220129, partial [Phyllosticta citrichinensis]